MFNKVCIVGNEGCNCHAERACCLCSLMTFPWQCPFRHNVIQRWIMERVFIITQQTWPNGYCLLLVGTVGFEPHRKNIRNYISSNAWASSLNIMGVFVVSLLLCTSQQWPKFFSTSFLFACNSELDWNLCEIAPLSSTDYDRTKKSNPVRP